MNKYLKIIFFVLFFIFIFVSMYDVKADILNDGDFSNGEKIYNYILKGNIEKANMREDGILEVRMIDGEISTIADIKFILENGRNINNIKMSSSFRGKTILINEKISIATKEGCRYDIDNKKVFFSGELDEPSFYLENLDTLNKLQPKWIGGGDFRDAWEEAPIKIVTNKDSTYFYCDWCNFSKIRGTLKFYPVEDYDDPQLRIYNSNIKFLNTTIVNIRTGDITIEAGKEIMLNSKKIKSDKPIKIRLEKDDVLGYVLKINLEDIKIGDAIVDGEVLWNSVGEEKFNNDFLLKKGTISYLEGDLIINGENLFIFEETINPEREILKFNNIFEKGNLNAIALNDKIAISDTSNVEIDYNGQRVIFENGKPKINIESNTENLFEIKKIEVSRGKYLDIDQRGKTVWKEEDKKYPVTIVDLNKGITKKAMEELDFFYLKEARNTIPEKIEISDITLGKGFYDIEQDKIVVSNDEYGISSGANRVKEIGHHTLFDVSTHEGGHAIWFNYINKEKKDDFDKDISFFLNTSEPGKKINEILQKHYSRYLNSEKDYTIRVGHRVEAVEGWAFTAEFIYLSCRDVFDYKFSQDILKHYKGIINQECLDKVKEEKEYPELPTLHI